METKSVGWVGMEWKLDGMEMKSEGMGEDGCNFHPSAGLY